MGFDDSHIQLRNEYNRKAHDHPANCGYLRQVTKRGTANPHSYMNTLEYILNKYNLPTEGTPIEIPNVGRIDIIRWIKELGFKEGQR